MSEYNNVPKIRFKGYTDAWEQRKVTDIGKLSIGLVTTMTSHYTDKGTLLIRNSDIKDNRFEFSDEPIYLDEEFANKNANRKHEIGDVITVHTGDVGTSAVIDKNTDKSIGFATIITRPNLKIIDSYYLSTFLNTEKHKKWAVSISTGDGRTNYNLGDYQKLVVPLTSLDEQRKIANFILNLDNLITLHQRKCETLVNVKKSLLEKMFPKNSSNIPEIRFKGFTDVWEQRKLEDITQIVMGQSPDSVNYTENSDDTVLIQGNADLNNGIVVPRIWSSQITKKSYPNDIIFTVRAPVGEIARNPYFATIGRGVASFKGNDFLYQSLIQKKENNYWNNISAGSTFDSINSDQLKNVIIDLPKNNLEQDKIGELFTKLDNLITLHQRKLEKLKNIKKSMLDKMFV